MIKKYYNFVVNGKKLRFAFVSLNIFPLDNKVRKFSINMVENKWFELTIIILIILNSVFLGMVDYTDAEGKSWGNQLVSIFY
jgi:hypothetical protein